VAAVVLCLSSLYLICAKGGAGLPRDVVIQGALSESEATRLYAANHRTLHALYWRRLRANLRAGQFNELWLNLRRRPERIHTLGKDPDGWFVASATNRLGEACTIRTQKIDASLPVGPWKVSQTNRIVVAIDKRAQPGAAPNAPPPPPAPAP
jgi:hypothetical protein